MTSTYPNPTREEWRRRVETELGPGRDFDRALVTRTLEGIPIAPLYTAEDATDVAAGAVSPRGGGWTIAQSAAHPAPKTANSRLLEDLTEGATGCFVELAGTSRRGVCVEWLHDLDALLDGVYLDAIPIAFGTGANGLPLAATFVALCRERDVDPARVAAHFGMDPIATLAAGGALPGDMSDARRELCLLAHHSRIELDRARSLAVDAGVWYRAGGHAVLELGYALASFVEMLRWLEESGLPPAAAHSEFVWRFDVGRELLTEISKLRAARVLHAKVLGGAGVQQATPLALHATTSLRGLSRRDAWTNMLRTSLGTIAAATGGADLVTTVAFDAPYGEPSALGRRNARNVQLVLEREARLDHVGDPGRGAYAIEARTDAFAREAWELMRDIERHGGMAAALRSGRITDELAAARDALRGEIATRRWPIIGVSEYPAHAGERRQDTNDTEDSGAADRAARIAARGSVVLGAIDGFEHAVDAAAGGATLGEIGDALVRGARERIDALPSFREASVFEDLADAADLMDRRPKVFLACLGSLAAHAARAAFAAHLFHAGALDVVQSDPDLAPGGLTAAFTASGATIACLCGRDDDYDLMAEDAARALGAAGARAILIARKRADGDDPLRAAGLTGYVHMGCDAEAVLRGLLELEGAVLAATEVSA